MSENLEIKFAAELAMLSIEKALTTIGTPTRAAFRVILQSVSDAYSPYLESTFRKVKTIRTFLKPNEPVDLIEN